jgi:MerR family transcriptional regulator, copper efflux regulator
LVRAWDEGECAPVKQRLQALVDAKFADVQGLITDQERFAAELRATAASLDARSPEGPCDARCGCTTAPSPADGADGPVSCGCPGTGDEVRAGPPSAALGRRTAGAGSVACSLDVDERQARIDGWQRVLADVIERIAIPGGLRIVLGPSAPVGEISASAVAENGCCPFFCFAVTVDGRGNALEVTAPAEGRRLLRSIFGGATSRAGR